MAHTITVDQAGRVVLPAALRRALNLARLPGHLPPGRSAHRRDRRV
ncbi:MAG: AbrB/MazE/SpoVT family DNA-binding domain-containing protein [Planctomycetota bacterium]|jgi:hypothetical protein|nr:hypothetical protein [Burkholderiaceae bacterium]